jgi:hypothetical protein
MDNALLLIAERRGMVGDSVRLVTKTRCSQPKAAACQTDKRGSRDFRSRRRAPPWC